MIGAIFDAWHFVTGIPHFLATVQWATFLVGLVLGMLYGAQGGWKAVLPVLTIGVGLFFMFRQKQIDEHPHEHVAGKDAVTVPRKPQGKRRFNPDTNHWE